MKRTMAMMVFGGAVLLTGVLTSPAASEAEVNVNVGIGLPALAISAPPAMVVIPGSYAYVAPDVEAGLFLYQGVWYRSYQGAWYAAVEYNGPWGRVAIGSVPPAIIGYSRDSSESRDEHPMSGQGHGHGMGMGMMGMGMGRR